MTILKELEGLAREHDRHMQDLRCGPHSDCVESFVVKYSTGISPRFFVDFLESEYDISHKR